MPIFSFFNCFDYQIIVSIIISLISFGIICVLINAKIKAFFSTIWELSSVLLSDIIARRINGNIKRLLTGIFLLSCVLLLSLFSGGLYEKLIRKQPIDRINSLEDLFTKPGFNTMKILAPEFLELNGFIEYDSSEMALNFKNRTVLFDAYDLFWNESYRNSIFDDVRSSKAVIVFGDKYFLHSFAYNHENLYKMLHSNQYYISDHGFGVMPHFILYSYRIDVSLQQKCDKM